MKAKKCEQTQRVTSDSRQLARPVEVSLNGRRNATLHLDRRPKTSLVRVNFQNWQVGLMSALAASTTFPSVPAFPTGDDAHWETQNCTVWNEREHASEERELVYEISWIAELGIWRRFLRSNRKVQS